jgi:hypothetical protein
MTRSRFLFVLLLATALSTSSARADDARRHGREAPSRQLPSHVFQLAAHQPRKVQLTFHYGLLQPIVMHGLNAALDLRYRRLIMSYSHGAGLDATRFVSAREKAAGVQLHMPWSTGGGVGMVLIDELWVLADLKVHHFELQTQHEHASYTNVTVGGELGWRYFVWKGLNVGLVVRYWPNVHSSAGSGVRLRDAQGNSFKHKPLEQGSSGFFGNVLVGWAFDL